MIHYVLQVRDEEAGVECVANSSNSHDAIPAQKPSVTR